MEQRMRECGAPLAVGAFLSQVCSDKESKTVKTSVVNCGYMYYQTLNIFSVKTLFS